MKTIRERERLCRFATAISRIVVLMSAGITPPASAALPRFTSAVELKQLSGAPADLHDLDISQTGPVSAGYGAAGTLNGSPVRWDANGSAISLSLPAEYNGGYVYVYGINNAGQVVGTVAPGRAVRWEASGSPTLLAPPPGPDTYAFFAYGINNVGQAVGVAGGLSFNDRGARWAADGSCTVLGDVPGLTTTRSIAYNVSDTGIAVGYFEVPDFSRGPVRWAADGSATLLGRAPGRWGIDTYAIGVNNAGEAVGYTDFGITAQAVRWGADGSATRLADLPGRIIASSVARSITNDGLIGGQQYEPDIANHAVIWDADGTPSLLRDLMADGNTWTFGEFDGIDADATTIRVLAIGSKNGGPSNYYLLEATVPEPSSLSLLAVAALMLRRARPARRPNVEDQRREADDQRTALPLAARAIAVPAVVTLLLSCAATDARGAWTYVNLHPAGAQDGTGLVGVADGQQVGFAGGTTTRATAALWSGTAGSYASLNPSGSHSASAHGVSQGKQVGQLVLPGIDGHAVMWSGAANSYVDLQPAATYSSDARGIRGNQQVGYVVLEPAFSVVPHASLWSGTAASWVDLHPAGALSSVAYGVDGNQQVGSASVVGSHDHASLWTGTAASWVDLEPTPSLGAFPIFVSVANAVHGGQQVGTITYNVSGLPVDHAGYWNGTADSWVDLNPDTTSLYSTSRANAVFGGYQVGQTDAQFCDRGGCDGSEHAAFWHGTRESWVDLESFLPANYFGSNALGVWTDGQTIQVAGWARNNTLNRSEAILWTNTVPEPGALAIALTGL